MEKKERQVDIDVKVSLSEKSEKSNGNIELQRNNNKNQNAFKTFFVGNKFIISGVLIIIFSNVLLSLMGLLNAGMKPSFLWLGIIICIFFIAIHVFVSIFLSKSYATKQFNIKKINTIREKNGECVSKITKLQEYSIFKAYLTGFIASIPLIVFCIVALALNQLAYESFAPVVRITYGLFFNIFLLINPETHVAFALIGVVINSLSFGLGYQLHIEKLKTQQYLIEQKQREIHAVHIDVNGSHDIDV